MCNARRHFIKEPGVGKKENEDDRMRSEGGMGSGAGGGGGGDEHLIGLPVTGQGEHKQSASVPAVSVCNTLDSGCQLKVYAV